MAAIMQDVALLAGVSVKTVSNVVNDYKHVSKATRERVQKAIDKLGYEVNFSARNLRTGRTGLISLVVPELKMHYFAELADAVITEAEKAGMRVIIEQTSADRGVETELLQGRPRQMVDGVLFSPLGLGQEDIHLFSVDFPMVLLGERVFGSPNDHVTMNNVEAAQAATRHLIQSGRRRIAILGAYPGEVVGSSALRVQGYLAALAEAGIPVADELLVQTDSWHRHTGASAIQHLIDNGIEFDAAFGMNDALALGALHALHLNRVRIPDEVAVIGFDDIEDAAFAHPTLTSVDPGRLQIARDAVRLLIERIAEWGKPPVDRRPVQRILADYTVVERESTAVAPV